MQARVWEGAGPAKNGLAFDRIFGRLQGGLLKSRAMKRSTRRARRVIVAKFAPSRLEYKNNTHSYPCPPLWALNAAGSLFRDACRARVEAPGGLLADQPPVELAAGTARANAARSPERGVSLVRFVRDEEGAARDLRDVRSADPHRDLGRSA